MTAPKPEPAECGECGCIHRPGENSMCPGWRPGPYDGPRDDEPEADAESLIERLDEALCSLLHTGGEIGEHSPRTHLDLFYAKQAESPVAAPCDTGELIDYLEAAARDLPLEQFLIAMRCKLEGGGSGCKEYAQSQNQLATVIEQRDTEKEARGQDILALNRAIDQLNLDLERNKRLKLEAARDRETALARVKELEAQYGVLSDAFDQAIASNEVGARALHAAETALASARATIGRVAEYVGYLEQDIAAARKNRVPQTGMHVPYHGAFCSASISTIKDLERFARSMRELLTSHPAPVAVLPPISESDSG